MRLTEHDRAVLASALAEAMRAEAARQRRRAQAVLAATARQRESARRAWQTARRPQRPA
jgi:hypothetical protein